MRLINTRTLKIQNFFGKPPPYAILSHTWGSEEVSYQDFHTPDLRASKSGYAKIEATCRQARSQGLDYAWVDTCCIDKTSSAELGEAINSMFRWYRDSSICYAFLEDVTVREARATPSATSVGDVGFCHSRWFTRGWTLQELIAPQNLEFFNRDWKRVGIKDDLAEDLQSITGIDKFVLKGGPLQQVSVGRRMSWASSRQVSREEDAAYCLLGIFNVNMPLIYGEGTKSFLRLQEEILRRSNDHTLFAWQSDEEHTKQSPLTGLFADSPHQFKNFLGSSFDPKDSVVERAISEATPHHAVRVWDSTAPHNPITLTNKGIMITSRMFDLSESIPRELMILVLNCSPGGHPFLLTGIYIRRQKEDRYARVRPDLLVDVEIGNGKFETCTIHGVRSADEVQSHRYDEPWTDTDKISQEVFHEFVYRSSGGVESVRERYTDAVYMARSSIRKWTIFGEYVLHAIFTGDGQGHYRFFRFDSVYHSDLVIKNHPQLAAILVMRSTSNPSDILLILLRTCMVDGIETLCFDTVQAREEMLAETLSSILDLFDSRSWVSSGERKKATVSKGRLKVLVSISPIEIEEIPMKGVWISGPWPVSFKAWISIIGDTVIPLTMLTYPYLFIWFISMGFL